MRHAMGCLVALCLTTTSPAAAPVRPLDEATCRAMLESGYAERAGIEALMKLCPMLTADEIATKVHGYRP